MTRELIESNLNKLKSSIVDIASNILSTKGSAGNNNEELARILSAYELFIFGMNWQEKENYQNLPHIITQYQASLDAQYHNDYKAVLIAEEIAKRQSERRGNSISIMNQ